MNDIAVNGLSVEERASNVGIVEDVSQFEDLLGLLRREIGKRFGFAFTGVVEFGGSLWIHRLSTPDAQRFVPWRLATTSRAFERGDRVCLLFGDVDPVESGELTVGVLREDRDVAGSDLASADPAVMFLNMSLVQVPRGEEGSAGLPEVCERDGLVDAGTLGGLVEDLRDHPVGDLLALVDLRPERRVGIVAIRMGVEPPVDVGDRRDQHDCSSALLPFDGDLQAVIVVLNVADLEVLELAPAETGIELQGDHGRIARVVARIEHRLDVFLPLEHVSRVGCRVVVVRGTGGNPVDRCGALVVVTVTDSLREDTECGPVVSVRLLVVVGTVDPGNDLLGGISLLEGGREEILVEILGHDDTVPEELLMTVVRVLLSEQVEPIAELEQELTITVADLITGLDPLAKRVDSVAWCRRHGLLEFAYNHKDLALNLGFPALHRLTFATNIT